MTNKFDACIRCDRANNNKNKTSLCPSSIVFAISTQAFFIQTHVEIAVCIQTHPKYRMKSISNQKKERINSLSNQLHMRELERQQHILFIWSRSLSFVSISYISFFSPDKKITTRTKEKNIHTKHTDRPLSLFFGDFCFRVGIVRLFFLYSHSFVFILTLENRAFLTWLCFNWKNKNFTISGCQNINMKWFACIIFFQLVSTFSSES